MNDTSSNKFSVSFSEQSQLIDNLQKGDQHAIRTFIDSHKDSIFSLAVRLTGNSDDADDLAQEVFLKALKGISSFRGDSSLQTWLHSITVRTYIDFTRSARYNNQHQHISLDSLKDSRVDTEKTMSPESLAERADTKELIEKGIAELTPAERSVFMLRQMQGYSVKETAEQLKVTDGTVKTLHFRAIRTLRAFLQPHL